MEAVMEQTELEQIRAQVNQAVEERFPGAPIEEVDVLQYGDDPEVEPGQLLVRISIAAPDDPPERMRAFEAFHHERREAIHEFRRDLDRLPAPALFQLFAGGGQPGKSAGVVGTRERGPRIQLLPSRFAACAPGEAGPGPESPGLTPVMARLGPDDLATLDTLITAGIASSRAEAVRWALARIRERPAYEQLRAHTREIENLKSQF
jgi:hypothetical protein